MCGREQGGVGWSQTPLSSCFRMATVSFPFTYPPSLPPFLPLPFASAPPPSALPFLALPREVLRDACSYLRAWDLSALVQTCRALGDEAESGVVEEVGREGGKEGRNQGRGKGGGGVRCISVPAFGDRAESEAVEVVGLPSLPPSFGPAFHSSLSFRVSITPLPSLLPSLLSSPSLI